MAPVLTFRRDHMPAALTTPDLLIPDLRNTLGEGPLWHPLLQRLFWFDIPEGRIHWSNADGTETGTRQLGMIASAAAWIDETSLLIAAEDGLYTYDIASHAMTLATPLETDKPDNRSNDGRCDPWGRFWVGTMHRKAKAGEGALYIYDIASGLTCIRQGLTIPNSIAFAPDRRSAYFADSMTRQIIAFDLDPTTGNIIGERLFASDEGEVFGPDGSVTDAEGCLWNARWGGSQIVRYLPDGRVDRIIDFPVEQMSCPAFGGADLDILFVTSAKERMSDKALLAQPLAGGIFAVRTDVRGVPEPRFGARP
jgi:sugar lactone lactonase YvrE